MTATLVLMAALVGCDGYGFGCGCAGYYGSYGYCGGYSGCGYSDGWLPYHHYSIWGDPGWYSGYYGGCSTCGYSYGWLPYHHYSIWSGPTFDPGCCGSGLPYGLPYQTPSAPPPATAPATTTTERAAGPDLDSPQRVVRVPVLYRTRPAEVTIRAGDAVEWRNDTSHTQRVIADPKQAVDAEQVELPKGTQAFDSGEIVPGASFQHTFDVPGTYVYVCRMRGAEGVAGTVVVKDVGVHGAPRPIPSEQMSTWQRPMPRTAPLFTDNHYRTAGNGVQRPLVLTADRDR